MVMKERRLVGAGLNERKSMGIDDASVLRAATKKTTAVAGRVNGKKKNKKKKSHGIKGGCGSAGEKVETAETHLKQKHTHNKIRKRRAHLHHTAITPCPSTVTAATHGPYGSGGGVLLRHDEQGGHPVAHEKGKKARVLPPSDPELLEHVRVPSHEA